ncbi:MAG: type I methionyl aminopeptidase [Lachnospiraceae bacterium]|nr:type I methionyl aminopeptidase [Lachnospiraceae bacterium]
MPVSIKTQEEIALMREAGRILAIVHEEMKKALCPGISTYKIDKLGEEIIRSYGCIPSCLGYEGYPASVCISINDEVIHGIPDKKRLIREGDLVSLDTVLSYKGYHADATRSYSVGPNPRAEDLVRVTRQSFFEGLRYAKAGNRLSDVAGAIQKYAEGHGYSVVRDFTGHGIGKEMHEEPEVYNYVRPFRKGIKLVPGMTLAVEPMINEGSPDVAILDDDWTVVTCDGSLAAHYENTILITDKEPVILTRADGIDL